MTKSLKAKDQEDRKSRDGRGNQKDYTKQESRDKEEKGETEKETRKHRWEKTGEI